MSRDFVEFINSEDVKQYVRETGYQLSSQEADFVVWQSKDTPLEERFAAWEEIIETMPDSSFAGYRHFNFKTKQMEPAPVYSLLIFCGSTSSGRGSCWRPSPRKGTVPTRWRNGKAPGWAAKSTTGSRQKAGTDAMGT